MGTMALISQQTHQITRDGPQTGTDRGGGARRRGGFGDMQRMNSDLGSGEDFSGRIKA